MIFHEFPHRDTREFLICCARSLKYTNSLRVPFRWTVENENLLNFEKWGRKLNTRGKGETKKIEEKCIKEKGKSRRRYGFPGEQFQVVSRKVVHLLIAGVCTRVARRWLLYIANSLDCFERSQWENDFYGNLGAVLWKRVVYALVATLLVGCNEAERVENKRVLQVNIRRTRDSFHPLFISIIFFFLHWFFDHFQVLQLSLYFPFSSLSSSF